MTAIFILTLLFAYLVIANLFHLVIFPEKKPTIADYFIPGEEFYSKTEGFRQKVIRQQDGRVYCTLEIDPYAGGPPNIFTTSSMRCLRLKMAS